MADSIEIVLGLLTAMLILVAFARKIQISYPIVLVVAGLGFGFIPGLPKIELEPELVFVLFLPPILLYSAYLTPIRDFRANLRGISLLAVGLVLVTTVAVAVVAHLVIGLPWAVGFVLGAIIAPPDAIAATAIAQRLHLPRPIVSLLEGESLLNDATSLVAYRAALAAVGTGTFSLLEAGGQFVIAAVGGVLVGVVVAVVSAYVYRRVVDDIPVYLLLTFVTSYLAFILADQVLHVSGVLAVIALGFAERHPRLDSMTPQLRLQGYPLWTIVNFLLNGLIFLLIGIQFGHIVERLSGQSLLDLCWYALVICLTVIIVRFVWVLPGAYIPFLFPGVRHRERRPPVRGVTVVAWTGMRGIVSLASALAIPVTIENYGPFPDRDLVIFLTFAVILVTLVGQGLSLPLVIRVLNVVDDGQEIHEENRARLEAAQAGQQRLNQLALETELPRKILEKVGKMYDVRIRRLSARNDGNEEVEIEQHFTNYLSLEMELLDAEMQTVIRLRNEGVINDEVLRRVQYDLDLERIRLNGY